MTINNAFIKEAILKVLFKACIIGVMVAGLVVLWGRNPIEQIFWSNTQIGIVEDGNFDITIKNPSLLQVESKLAAEADGISAVVPYYIFVCDIPIDEDSQKRGAASTVVLFDSFDRLDHTPYNADRILKGSVKHAENSAVVDYAFSKKFGISVGDSLPIVFGKQYQSIRFNVCAIAETNPLEGDGGTVAIQYVGAQKKIVESDREVSLSYAGAYIKCAEAVDRVYQALAENYKPLGIKKSPSQFESYSMYEAYVQDFESRDYAYLVKKVEDSVKTDVARAGLQTAQQDILIVAVLSVAVIVCVNVVYLLLKRKKIRDNYETKRKYYTGIFDLLFNFLFAGGVVAGFVAVYASLIAPAYPIGTIMKEFSVVYICITVGAVCGYGLNFLIVWSFQPKRNIKKQRAVQLENKQIPIQQSPNSRSFLSMCLRSKKR